MSDWTINRVSGFDGRPAVTTMPDSIHAFITRSKRAYHSMWTHGVSKAWAKPEPLPGAGSWMSIPAAVSAEDGRLDVFAIGSEGELLHARSDRGDEWSLESLGGDYPALGAPAVAVSDGNFHIFMVKGDQLIHVRRTVLNEIFPVEGAPPNAPETLPGRWLYFVAAVANTTGVHVLGLDPDHRLQHAERAGSAWVVQRLSDAHSFTNTRPAAVASGPSRLDVVGLADDNDVLRVWREGTGDWHGPTSLEQSSPLAAAPGLAAATDSAHTVRIVANDGKGRLLLREIRDKPLLSFDWSPIDGSWISQPVIAWSQRHFDVLARGRDGQLWHAHRDDLVIR
jgi:hypothetical protein